VHGAYAAEVLTGQEYRSKHPREFGRRSAWGLLAAAGAALFGQTCKPLSGGVAHRHLGMPHSACIGWPAWTETSPRLRASLYGCDEMGQPCSAERAAARVTHLAHHLCAETDGNFVDVFCHIHLRPFLAFRLLRHRGFFQRKSDLKVIVVNNQYDSTLPRLTSHQVEKVPKHGLLLVNQMLARVALNDNWVIKQEFATLSVVTPNTFAPWEGSGPTQK
jgi:hypothetical protein